MKCDSCNNRMCKDAYPPFNDIYASKCINNRYFLYLPDPQKDETKYSKECPFCGEVCYGFKEQNLYCKCSGKYYWDDKSWYQRSSGKVLFEH